MRDRGTRACIGRLCGEDTAWTATTSATADTRSAAATGQPASHRWTSCGSCPPWWCCSGCRCRVLAVGDDGTILFANAAFSQMLGHTAEAVLSLTFAQIFAGQPADTSPVMFIRAHAHQLVELVHRDGSTVRATMSPSALLRADDTVALATFHDRTEELWLKNR